MSDDLNWQEFYQQKSNHYIKHWVSYSRLYAHDYPSLEAELPNLFASAEQASESGDYRSELAFVQSLCTGEGAFLDLRGFMSDSARLLAWAVDAARALGDKGEEGRLLGSLGLCWWALGKYGNAIDCYENALAIAKEVGDRQTQGRHLGSLGLVWASLMDSRMAISYFAEAISVAREVGDQQAEESHLGSLGLIWAEEGMFRMAQAQDAKETAAPYFRRAIRHYEQALAIAQEIGDRRGEGSQLGNLGNAWSYLGEGSKAIDYIQQALVILRETGDRRNEGFHLANLGSIYHTLGKIEEARQFWQEALAVYDAYGDPRAVTVRTLLNETKEPIQAQANLKVH